MTFTTRSPRDQQSRVTLGKTEVDPRVLTKAEVRALMQLLHPDRYRGDSSELAARLFLRFKDYEGV